MRIGENQFGTREVQACLQQHKLLWRNEPHESHPHDPQPHENLHSHSHDPSHPHNPHNPHGKSRSHTRDNLDPSNPVAGQVNGPELALSESYSENWPDEDQLFARREKDIDLLTDFYLSLTRGERSSVSTLRELACTMIGLCLDSPRRAAHIALLGNYRWKGSDDSPAAEHAADDSNFHVWVRTVAQYSFTASFMAVLLTLNSGLSADLVRRAGVATMLRDTGMLLLPPRLRLMKRTPGEVESGLLLQHPALSLYICSETTDADLETLRLVYQHHERANGSGYPEGISDVSQSFLTKYIAVADAWTCAVEPERGSAPGLPYDATVDILTRTRAGEFDREAARALVESLGLFPVGSIVQLERGGSAVVLASHARTPDRPLVRLLAGSSQGLRIIDLAAPVNAQLRIRAAQPRWSMSLPAEYMQLPSPRPVAA